ncbi:AraC family transcriptional regulator [Desulfotomaculum arcticum]|uniref:AraC family transcriptional regulator n=1 Tax=Desulfotruncus arcticus DSM 17038 TaxID=1121424 RepID=A0A1I2TVN7_9FIRM|nr:AraC family transcriptional regulator [Desulfotruncus arcticus]SFG68940.1 AraC family transcriptional regulator [Desulfotomaculum arcticum] [Desulfotruncus arcticus DSM 17038]
MESWEPVQQTLDYIEKNLSSDIQIQKLSQMACLSPFYYQRLFRRLVGKPVMEYVKLRRLANAASLLASGGDRIIDVSLALGFENPETFTRSFKDAYGLTPNAYRKQPRPLTHFIKPDLSMRYRLVDENVPLVANGIVLEVNRRKLLSTRHFAGLSIDAKFPDNPSIDFLAELWHNFHIRKSDIDNIKQDGNEIGVGRPSEREGYLRYFVGAETNGSNTQNEFEYFEMPNGSYVVCTFEAEDFHLLTTDALDKAVKYMYDTWLLKNKIKTEPFMIELYSDTSSDDASEDASMDIWFKTIASGD